MNEETRKNEEIGKNEEIRENEEIRDDALENVSGGIGRLAFRGVELSDTPTNDF